MNNKITGTLGICRRAGHLTMGFDAVKALIEQRRAMLVLTAADLSEKSRKEIVFVVSDTDIPVYSLSFDEASLSAALGLQKPVGIIATDDRGFAASLMKHIPAEQKEDDAL